MSVNYNIPVIQIYFRHRKRINVTLREVLDIWLTLIAEGKNFFGRVNI